MRARKAKRLTVHRDDRRRGYPMFFITPKGFKTPVIRVLPLLQGHRDAVRGYCLNWSLLGNASVKETQSFARALLKGIRIAKQKHRSRGTK
jgi:hypothetical protein